MTTTPAAAVRGTPPVTLDMDAYRCTIAGEIVPLRTKEFRLLSFLVNNAGKVVSHQQIAAAVWQSDVRWVGKTIQVHIGQLRRKIGDGSITTIRNAGYRWDGHATVSPPDVLDDLTRSVIAAKVRTLSDVYQGGDPAVLVACREVAETAACLVEGGMP